MNKVTLFLTLIYFTLSLFSFGNAITLSDAEKKAKLKVQGKIEEKISKINGYTYDWIQSDLHPYNGSDTGIIAQEVETIDNSWVSENSFQEDALATPPNLTEEKALRDGGNQKTVKLGKKDAMYVSVIQQLITRIEALEG